MCHSERSEESHSIRDTFYLKGGGIIAMVTIIINRMRRVISPIIRFLFSILSPFLHPKEAGQACTYADYSIQMPYVLWEFSTTHVARSIRSVCSKETLNVIAGEAWQSRNPTCHSDPEHSEGEESQEKNFDLCIVILIFNF